MKFTILTLFPEALEPYLAASILGRAQEAKLIEVGLWNIRDYATDKHRTTDDTPYGGGAGMVMKVEPIHNALNAVGGEKNKRKVVVLSAKGAQFTQVKAAEYAKLDELVLICGRYEGVDQRVIDHLADEEISVGSYVLAGGELPALTVLEATARLIPGVLGNEESLLEESYAGAASSQDTDVREYPQYTKPEEYRGWKVPEVLLSGNHPAIKKWRQAQQKK